MNILFLSLPPSLHIIAWNFFLPYLISFCIVFVSFPHFSFLFFLLTLFLSFFLFFLFSFPLSFFLFFSFFPYVSLFFLSFILSFFFSSFRFLLLPIIFVYPTLFFFFSHSNPLSPFREFNSHLKSSTSFADSIQPLLPSPSLLALPPPLPLTPMMFHALFYIRCLSQTRKCSRFGCVKMRKGAKEAF